MRQVSELNISAFLKQKIEDFSVAPVEFVRGTVTTSGDGVVRVKDLPRRLYGELLEFDGGVMGMALDLDENGSGAVLFDSADEVKVGDGVRGTGAVADDRLEEAVRKVFDLRPTAIIRDLDLRRPIYRPLAAYGHMGREDLNVPWERTDKVDALKAAL